MNASALRAAFALVVGFGLAAPGLSHAGLLGSTVDVTARYPDASSIFSDPGAQVVTAGVEYPAGSFSTYNPSWQVNVSDTSISITDSSSGGLPYATATFNGWVLDVLSGPAIASAVIDGSSTIVPHDIYVSGGELFINMSGVSATSGGTTLVDFTTAGVPEPATWLLMIGGAFGIGAALRRSRGEVPAV